MFSVGCPVAMIKRPLSVTIIGCLFVAAGTVGLVYHAREFTTDRPLQYGLLLVCLLRLLAIVCGAFLLRGHNWARWGLLAWIAYHVVLSAFHSVFEFVVHGLLLALIAWFLLRPPVSAYSRRASPMRSDTGDEKNRGQR